MIVAFEGIDASGKQTQSLKLAQKLAAARLSFPNYDTESGRIIRAYLNGHCYTVPAMYDGHVFQALQTINRLEMYGLIMELQRHGRAIVFDRYYASALVYGTADGVSEEWIKLIQAPLPEPDHQVLIDIPVAESFTRRPDKRDARYEAKAEILEEVRKRYLHLFNKERNRDNHGEYAKLRNWHIVDGVGTIEEVHERICAAVGAR